MTIEVSPDFSELTITVDDFVDLDNVVGGTGHYFTNCEDTQYNFDIDQMLSNKSGQVMTLSADAIYVDRTTFPDGVYSFEIVLYEGSLVQTFTYTYCLYVGTTSACKAYKWYNCTGDEVIEYLIKALQYVNECDDCECSTMCDVYEALLNRIDYLANKNKSNVYNDCGCP